MDPESRKIDANNNNDNADDVSINTAEIGLDSTEDEIDDDENNANQQNADVTDGIKDNQRGLVSLDFDEITEVIDVASEENSDREDRKLLWFGYAGKKTVAQGMMDIALITANANQLRYVMEFTRGSHTYHLTVTLIAISLTLQVAVGMFLIFKGRYDVKGESKSINARRINNLVLLSVFLITIVNVFIASFTTMENTNVAAKL